MISTTLLYCDITIYRDTKEESAIYSQILRCDDSFDIQLPALPLAIRPGHWAGSAVVFLGSAEYTG